MALCAPFAFWHRVPQHHPTCVCACASVPATPHSSTAASTHTVGSSTVLTGSAEGTLCLWREGRAVALLCSSLEAPVCAVCPCSYFLEAAFAAVAADGSLSVWDVHSGACLALSAYTGLWVWPWVVPLPVPMGGVVPSAGTHHTTPCERGQGGSGPVPPFLPVCVCVCV